MAIEDLIRNQVGALDAMGKRGPLLDFLKDRPIPSPEAGEAITAAVSNPGWGAFDIFKIPGAPAIENVMKGYQAGGASALSSELETARTSKPTTPNVDLSGVQRASANALGGNVRVPDVMTEYVKKAETDYQSNLQNWQSQYQNLQTGWGVLNSLNDPNVSKGLTMSYLQGTLMDLEQAFPGSIPANAMNALNQLYAQSDEYAKTMSSFFKNTLALKFDLSSDVNQAVLANNYSKWLSDIISGTPAIQPPPPGGESGGA